MSLIHREKVGSLLTPSAGVPVAVAVISVEVGVAVAVAV
jgi:hypothetical protein